MEPSFAAGHSSDEQTKPQRFAELTGVPRRGEWCGDLSHHKIRALTSKSISTVDPIFHPLTDESFMHKSTASIPRNLSSPRAMKEEKPKSPTNGERSALSKIAPRTQIRLGA